MLATTKKNMIGLLADTTKRKRIRIRCSSFLLGLRSNLNPARFPDQNLGGWQNSQKSTSKFLFRAGARNGLNSHTTRQNSVRNGLPCSCSRSILFGLVVAFIDECCDVTLLTWWIGIWYSDELAWHLEVSGSQCCWKIDVLMCWLLVCWGVHGQWVDLLITLCWGDTWWCFDAFTTGLMGNQLMWAVLMCWCHELVRYCVRGWCVCLGAIDVVNWD